MKFPQRAFICVLQHLKRIFQDVSGHEVLWNLEMQRCHGVSKRLDAVSVLCITENVLFCVYLVLLIPMH